MRNLQKWWCDRVLKLKYWKKLLEANSKQTSSIDALPEYLKLEAVDVHEVLLWRALIATCCAIFVWATLFPLDVVSVATGTVEPVSGLQKVQHLEGGIVRELLVKEGERVRKGQVLIKMEPVRSNSDMGEVDATLTSLQADLIRLEAEASGAKYLSFTSTFERNHPDAVSRARDLFRARRDNLQASKETQQKEITQRQQDIAEISARLSNTTGRHQYSVEQVAIGEKLLASELSNRYEQIERLKEANTLKSHMEEDQQALIRAQEGVAKSRAVLSEIGSKYDQDVRQALSETRQKIEEMASRGIKFRDALTRTELRAPMTGIVKTLYVKTVGAVVPAGDTLIDLVPEDSKVVVEAKLQPQDVGFVHVGQKAFVQLASAEASRFGRIRGKVTFLSADSVIDKEKGVAYYVVRVATDQPYFQAGQVRYPLLPGVQVSAGIITGTRNVLEYILSPIFQSVPYTMTER